MHSKRFADKSRMAYDRLAARYDTSLDGRFTRTFKRRLLARAVLRPGCRVLDVACGNGTLLRAMRRKELITGHGADISARTAEAAALRNPGMEFHVCGCEAMPFADASMDVLTVSAAYHHFPDVAAFAREASRILAPGGALYIAEIYLPGPLRALLNPLLPLSPHGDVRLYAPDEIVAGLSRHGFERVSIELCGHIQLLALRRR